MKKIFYLLFLALFLAELTKEVKSLLDVAHKEIPATDVKSLKKQIKDNQVVLLDVRESTEWKNGVIKSQKLIKIPKGILEFKYKELILNKYTKNDYFIVYSKSDSKSIFAAYRLKELGFKNVSYLKGGIKEYKKEKLKYITMRSL